MHKETKSIFASTGIWVYYAFFHEGPSGLNCSFFLSVWLSVSGNEHQTGPSGNSGWSLSDPGKNVQQLHRGSGKPGNHISDWKTRLVFSQGMVYISVYKHYVQCYFTVILLFGYCKSSIYQCFIIFCISWQMPQQYLNYAV